MVRRVGPSRVIAAATVTPHFFEVLGVAAEQGVIPRLTAGDARVVISAGLARTIAGETGRSARIGR